MARKEVGIRLSVKDKEVVERALKDVGREGKEALDAIRRTARPASDALMSVNGGARAARTALQQINGMARLARNSLGFLAGGFLGNALISSVRDAARGIAEIGDAARRAGLDVKSFQELKFVAEQNRIGVDSLTDGIKELNLRADEFITTGKGSAAEAFQRLGFSADELKRKLADPSELFTEIIGKLGQLDRSAAIRIADEIFGGSAGERFVELLDQGEAGIRRTIEAAHEAGIYTDDMIRKAEDLDRKFHAVATTVGNALKGAIVEAAGALATFMETVDQAGRELGSQSREYLERRLGELQAIKDKAEQGLIISRTHWDRKGLQAEYEAIQEELARRGSAIEITVGGGGGGGGGGIKPPDPKALADADRERKKIEGVMQALRDEIAMVGMAEEEKRVLNELRRAGVEAASAEGQTIRGLVSQLMAEEQAWKQIEDAIANVGGTARDVLGSILSDLRAGKDATEVWNNAFGKLIDRMMSSGLDMGIGAIQSWLTGALRPQASGGIMGNGLWGSAIPFGQAHSGWEVGRGNPPGVRRLSPSTVASLPRRHMGGLNADEQMIVARRGEGIFTPRQMDNADTLIAALMRNLERSREAQPSANLRVELVNPGGDKVVESATARRDGNGDIVAQIVLGAVRTAFADGRMDGMMGELYGVRRQAR